MWWSSEQSTGVRAAADAVRILMKTSTQLSCCCWVRKTNLRATKQSEKFLVRRWSIDHQFRGLFTKICVSSCCKERRAQQLTEAHSMHALFSVCSFRDDNVIKSKTYMKTETCKLYSRVFWIFLSISSKIDYNFELGLYRFKVVSFLRKCNGTSV